MMDRFFSEENKAIRIGYFILLLLVGIVLTVIGYQTYFHVYYEDMLRPEVLIVGTVIYGLLMLKMCQIYSKIHLTHKQETVLAFLLSAVFFFLLFCFASVLTVVPQYDLNHLQREASLMLEHGQGGFFNGRNAFDGSSYFSQYPNQVPLMLILYVVYRIGAFFGNTDYLQLGCIFNCACIALAALGVFYIARMKGSSKTAWMAFTIFMTNPIFYIYSSYSYSDTVCLPWAIWGIFFFLRFFDNDKASALKRGAGVLFSFLLLFIGYRIRATVIFLAIALCIYGIIVKLKKKYMLVIFMVVAFAVVSIGNKGMYSYFGITVDQNLSFPSTHWVMMGVNVERNGWYSDDDVRYTQSLETYDEKKEGTKEVIISRIKDIGVLGFARLSFEKLSSVWSSGDCTSGTFYSMEKHGILYNYIVGNHNIFWLYLLQFNRCGLILFVWIYVLAELKNKQRRISPLIITLFGAIVFYLFWEVHRRYSLNFLPWMFLIMAEGIERMGEHAVAISVSEKACALRKRIRWAGCICGIVIVVLLYGAGWNKYTAETKVYNERLIFQPNKNSNNTSKIDALSTAQTFQVDRSFNRIQFYFAEEEKEKGDAYILNIKTDDGEVLRTEKFNYEDIDDDGSVRVDFKSVVPDGLTNYCAEVTVDNAKSDTRIGICTYQYSDMITQGCAYFDGVASENTDWKMTLYQVHKGTYTSRKIYILLMVMSCALVLMCFAQPIHIMHKHTSEKE